MSIEDMVLKAEDGSEVAVPLGGAPLWDGLPTGEQCAAGTKVFVRFDVRQVPVAARQMLERSMASGATVAISFGGEFRMAKVDDYLALGSRGRVHLVLV